MESTTFQSAEDELEEACFEKANRLITECRIPVPKVTSISNINYRIFVLLFDAICKPKGPYYKDLKYHTNDSTDEAHNVQVVIDTLSLDLLGISMSHITGEDIVAGNTLSIYNLLEILEGCKTYLIQPENVPPVATTNIERSVPDSSRLHEVQLSDWICPACGHRKPYEELVVRQAGPKMEEFNCWCPSCHGSFPIARVLGMHPLVDCTFRSHSNRPVPSPSFRISNITANQLEEGTLSSLSKQSSNNSTISIPKPTFIEDGLLKPEFARVGVRDDSAEQTAVKRVVAASKQDFFATSSTSGNGAISTLSSRRESSTSIATSLPLSTAIFKGNAFVKSHHSKSYIPSQREEPERDTTSPKRRLSKSLDDILSSGSRQSTKQDESVQTSHSRISRKAKRQRTPSEPTERRKDDDIAPSDAHKELVDLYAQNMEQKIRQYLEKGIEHRRRASQINRAYQESIRTPKRKPLSPVCRKSFLLPYYLRRRTSITPKRIHARSDSRSSQNTSRVKNAQPVSVYEEAFLRELREEFPGVYLSPASIRKMSDKYQKHLVSLRKNVKGALLKKSQTQIQTEEAIRRQDILSKILRKEVHHVQNLNDFKGHQDLSRQVKVKARDARLDSVRMKQYHEEFCSDMQRKLQKRTCREEQMIKNVFDEGLQMQKEQIHDLRHQLRERETNDAKHHKIYLDSLENFYQTQFSLLAESLALEKRDMQERTKAQARVLRIMKRDNRKQMENEVRDMQEQLLRNSEELHFRELDVEHYREKLRDRYSSHPLAKNL